MAYTFVFVNQSQCEVDISNDVLQPGGKWTDALPKKIKGKSKPIEANAIALGNDKLQGSFLITVNGETFKCCFAYQAIMSSPTFTSTKESRDSSNYIIVTHQPPSARDGCASVTIVIKSVSASVYEFVVQRNSNGNKEVVKITDQEVSSSSNWVQKFNSTVKEDGSPDKAEAVSTQGPVSGSFKIEVGNGEQTFTCAFSYDADLTKPTFTTQSSTKTGLAKLQYSPPTVMNGVAMIEILVETIAPQPSTEYDLTVVNKTSQVVNITNTAVVNSKWKQPFQDTIAVKGPPDNAVAISSYEKPVSGSFDIAVGGLSSTTFKCKFTYGGLGVSRPVFTFEPAYLEQYTLDFVTSVKSREVACVEVTVRTLSVYEFVVRNESKEVVKITDQEVSSSSNWEQKFNSTVNEDGSPDKAKAVSTQGPVSGSFKIEVGNGEQTFACAFSYEADLTKPTFTAQSSTKTGRAKLQYSLPAIVNGIAKIDITVEASVVNPPTEYDLTVINKTSQDVNIANAVIANGEWKQPFQDKVAIKGPPDTAVAIASPDKPVSGSFNITIGSSVLFKCQFSYKGTGNDNQPVFSFDPSHMEQYTLGYVTSVDSKGVASVEVTVRPLSAYSIKILNKTALEGQILDQEVSGYGWAPKISTPIYQYPVQGMAIADGKLIGFFKISLPEAEFVCTLAYEVGVSDPYFQVTPQSVGRVHVEVDSPITSSSDIVNVTVNIFKI